MLIRKQTGLNQSEDFKFGRTRKQKFADRTRHEISGGEPFPPPPYLRVFWSSTASLRAIHKTAPPLRTFLSSWQPLLTGFSMTHSPLPSDAGQPTGRGSLRVKARLNWLITYLLTYGRLAPLTFCFLSCHCSAVKGCDSAKVWTWQLKRILLGKNTGSECPPSHPPTVVFLPLPSVCVFLSRFLSLQGNYVVVYKYWPWHLLSTLAAHGTGLCYWTPW